MAGLEVNPKLDTDRPKVTALVLFVPHVLVVGHVGVHLPKFALITGRTIIHVVILVGVASAAIRQGTLLLRLFLVLLLLLCLVMPLLVVGFDGVVTDIVIGFHVRRIVL